jgi:hypothetical protein
VCVCVCVCVEVCMVFHHVHKDSECPGKIFRATSHTRLRARDQYTSSTLIGGKGGTGPSSLLHTTPEGPMEYVNARWM